MAGERQFGRYVVERPLARGGMGTVYLGRVFGAHGFSRPVVIKTIRTDLGPDPRAAMMFVDEARIAATLHHRNICQILDFDVVDGGAFLVSEYVDGCDLRMLLKHVATPLPYAVVVALFAELGTGLHAAHEARGEDGTPLEIVHRDVSLGNVLLGKAGEVKLADFGIARARARSYHTVSGSVRGKPGYMAPEQILGETLDRRCDVFSLGILLFEVATRSRLYSAASDQTAMRMILEGVVPDPIERRADLPGPLATIIRKALARDRDARYATAAALVADLDTLAIERGLTLTTGPLGALATLVQSRLHQEAA